jgi:hypothetical protein
MNKKPEKTILAYLAGAMDSDGYFTIKKSSYYIRVRKDAHNYIYSEKIGLKQVTLDIPHLLKETFGGYLSKSKGQTPNSRPLYSFQCTNLQAAKACELLLPFLKVKRQQAQLLLELRESRKPIYLHLAYWFAEKFPEWKKMELITTNEAAKILAYKSVAMVSQAIRNGTLVAKDYKGGNELVPRIPKVLAETVMEHSQKSKDGRARNQPDELVLWREKLYGSVIELNKIGINGTSVYHREGVHELKKLA